MILRVALLTLPFLTFASIAQSDETLTDGVRVPANAGPLGTPEVLFQGDLGAEIGIGCSGGPNDVAVAVTSSLPVPFEIVEHSFYVWQASGFVTDLIFKVWGPGAVPQDERGSSPGLPITVGAHTVVFQKPILVETQDFFFGHSQPQEGQFIRWGVDTSSQSPTQSFIRAPGCDVPDFVSLDAIGFPGNFAMSVTVSNGPVPVELESWGTVKARYADKVADL